MTEPLRLVPKERESHPQNQDGWLEAFDADFWPSYPRKLGKFAARKAFQRIKPHDQATLDAICQGLDKWIAYWREHETDEQFIPYPATWLNQRRWEDMA